MPTSKVALHGGGGSKVPGFYEKHWTAFTLVDVLIGRADSITLEPPGTVGYGFEFFVERRSGREWHQVKYQNAELGKWSLASLRDGHVLDYFKSKLDADSDSSCTFVSAHAPHPLGRLCDSATESASLHHFLADFLSSKPLQDGFRELHEVHWVIDQFTAWSWLRERISIKTVDSTSLEIQLADRAEAYFNEPAQQVATALEQTTESILYRPETASTLIPKLAKLGATLRIPGPSGAALNRVTDRFVATSQATLVNSDFIERPAVSQIDRLIRRRGVSTVVVTGEKGCGKTAVLAEVVQHLRDDDIRVLPIDLTTLSTEANTDEVGRTFGLTASPIKLSAGAAGPEDLVIVVDSIDSLAASRGKPPTLFSAIAQVFRECESYPNITLLVSCRTQDLDTDLRVRALLSDPNPAQTVNIERLTLDETLDAIRRSGHNPAKLDNDQLQVLRVLANLNMFTRLPQSRLQPFSTEQELAGIYMEWAIAP